MSLPAVREDTGLDNLFYDHGGSACTVDLHLSGTFHEAIRTPADFPLDHKLGNAPLSEEGIGLAAWCGSPHTSNAEETGGTVCTDKPCSCRWGRGRLNLSDRNSASDKRDTLLRRSPTGSGTGR